jgi:hypothetical protein
MLLFTDQADSEMQINNADKAFHTFNTASLKIHLNAAVGRASSSRLQ